MTIKTRHFQRAGMVLGAAVAAVLFFLGGAALRLAMGPISLGPFAGAIEDSLNRSITGLAVRFDQAVLEWSRADGNINLIILGAKVFDVSGRIVAQAPKADLDFDAAAMLAGDFSLKRFTLLGVQLTAVRNTDGTLRLGFGPIQGDADLLEIIRNTLERSSNEGGSLETFSIRDARLAFRDEASGLFLISPKIGFALETADEQFQATLDGAVEISGAPAQLNARVLLREDGSPESGTATIGGLDLAALAANSDKFAFLASYPLKGDLKTRFTAGPDGMLNDIAFDLRASGAVTPPGFTSAMKLDEIALSGRFDRPGKLATVQSVAVRGPEIEAKGTGELRVAWAETENVLSTVTAGFVLQAAKIAPPGVFETPISFDEIVLQAGYEIAPRKLTVQRLDLKGNGVTAAFSGTVGIAERGSPAIAALGTMQPVEIRQLLAYWPSTVARGARQWLVEKVATGRLGVTQAAVRIPAGRLNGEPLAEEMVSVSFPLEDVTAEYMGGLTVLSAARGSATLSGNTFHVQMVDGRIGPLFVSGGDVTIPDLHLRNPLGRIRAHIDGSMPEVLALIDMRPLGYPTRFGVVPTSTAGQAGIDLDFQIPMRRNLNIEDLRLGVTAKVAGLALPIDAKRSIDNGNVSFVIDNETLAAEGTARLSGTPVTFKWNEQFVVPDGPTTRVELQGRVDDATRPALGLAQPDWVKGPMALTTVLTGRRFKFDRAVVRADLTATTAAIPAIGFEKRAGTAATGSATVDFVPGGGVRVSDLAVTGTGLAVRGDLDINAGGELTSADLSQVRAGENNDFSLAIAQGNGQRQWRVAGRSVDLRPLIEDDEDTAEGPAAGARPQQQRPEDGGFFARPITINGQVGKVLIRDEESLRDVRLALNMGANKRVNGFSLAAAGPGEKSRLTGRFAESGGTRRLTIESDSAADFMRAFTGFPSIRNGSAVLEVNFPADADAKNLDYAGTLTLRNFSVVDQPFIARLFAVGSLDGPLRLLQGQGIQFSQLEAPFTSRGDVLSFSEGKASSPAIGFSFQGQIDRKADTVDLNGSLVPIFGLNSMLGAIPVVGDLLVSKDGEGIIAMTYRVRGALDEPEIMVNPLSVLTPGIFRRIFEFGGPRAATPAQNTQTRTE